MIYLDGADPINIVSKHINPIDGNYLLRPFTFELVTYITGNTGPTQFLQMFNPVSLDQTTWYHVAGTYDGISAKYYVNGCLVAEEPFQGNLFQNDHSTAIGNQSDCQCEQFFGKIDEVRIWNVARTEEQIRNHMLDLPDPTSQLGLLAYYKLNNSLLNDQGDPAWNGDFVGNVEYDNDEASLQPFAVTDIQITNPDCDGLLDGSITVFTNRPGTLYSLDGISPQASNNFSNLESGNHQIFAESIEGCIVDTTVFVSESILYDSISIVETICQGEEYLGFSISGKYVDTLFNNLGCDTIRTIELTVLEGAMSSQMVNICEGEQYEGYSISGTFVDVFGAANGCDSIRTLTITVDSAIVTVFPINICEGEQYEGYSVSGSYVDTYVNSNGCDSIRTLDLTVEKSYESNQSVTLCPGAGYDFNGQLVTNAGTYIDSLFSITGCDSILILEVTIAQEQFLGNDIFSCSESEYELISPSENTVWFDGDISRTKIVYTDGVYWASILDTDGCEIMDTVVVQFGINSYVANIFSPNNDAVNDCMQPSFSVDAQIENYSFDIFDRWGNHVFTSTNVTDCWNGEWNNTMCTNGVYVYLLQYNSAQCGETIIKGDFNLIK